ncbi:MAG: RnfABCDGE type electron transport complex subunit B [Candidatus Brocadiia bacterium]
MVVISIIAMVTLGLLFGIGLALASRAFSVDTDDRIDKILQILPGANCGACGYGGCRAYAEAVVEGEDIGLCKAGGQKTTEEIADIMGVETSDIGAMRAVVHCQGGIGVCDRIADYNGPEDCRAAHIASGGPIACPYGCLGFGSCAEACPFDAITMTESRLPDIDPEKCTGCGVCVNVCPRDLISLLPIEYKIYLGCSNRDSGRSVKDICSKGCIACGVCEKKDPNEAIEIVNGLPQLDHEKAEGDFSEAADACPMDCFVIESAGQKPQQEDQAVGATS